MNLFEQIQYSQNWNICFCTLSEEELIANKGIDGVQWLKHPYKDRWFADPFIFSVTEKEIIVFVEELMIEKPKGYLVELIVNRQTKKLINRHVLLELSTHLSYPAYLRYKGRLYVYPENGASGKLNIYEYDAERHTLINPICVLDEALADATILQVGENEFYLIATKAPDVQEKAYLYKAFSPMGPFVSVSEEPVQMNRNCSCPAGNWFKSAHKLFRPAQDCVRGYGRAISIMRVDCLTPFKEQIVFTINPLSFRYNKGIHTINFFHTDKGENIAVLDGYGYLRPILGRIYYSKGVRAVISVMKKIHRTCFPVM